MQRDYYLVWQQCLQIIKDNISSQSFRAWFEPIVPVSLKNDVLTIRVPTPFFYEYLEANYIDLLSKTLKQVIGPKAKLEYQIVVDKKASEKNPKRGSYTVPGRNSAPVGNKPIEMPAAANTDIQNPLVIPGIKKQKIDSQLNFDYTFENFIEGKSNLLARNAGLQVAQKPGTTMYNPLMIHGPVGNGKTHLAQAIGVRIKELYPEKTVLYVSADRFQAQYTKAVRDNEINQFTSFYQMIDVLIIDDVHEFANKEGTQRTFFHIFNQLHQANKQLILTADRPPADLQGLNERLLSRFKWGLTVEIDLPDYDMRLKILKHKAYREGITVSDRVLDYIARNVTRNVRELEGALISLVAYATLNKQTITIELAKEVVKKIVKQTQKELTIDYIKKIVSEYFGLDPKVLNAKTRKREVVQARQIAMYFARLLTNASLTRIGSEIGGRDHSTVLYACKTVENLCETDKNFKNYVEDIERLLKY